MITASKSIVSKMLGIIVGCALLFAVVMGAYLFNFRQNLIEEANGTLALRLQTLVDAQIEGKLQILLTNAIGLSHNSRIIDALQRNDRESAISELKKILDDFIKVDFRGTGFHLIRANLTSFWRSFDERRDDDISHRQLLKQVVDKGSTLSGTEIGRVGVGLRAVAPVKDANGNLLGLVETTFGVGSVSRQMRKENAFYILLVEKNAVDPLQYRERTGAQEIGDRYLAAHGKWFDEETIAFASSANFDCLIKNRRCLGDRYFYAIEEAKDYSGKVFGLHLTGMSREHYDDLISPVFKMANNLLIAVVMMAILASLVILWMLRRIVITPVVLLSEFLVGMGNDLTRRFGWRSDDEIGRVSTTVNNFLGDLSSVLRGAVAKSAEVASSAAQLQNASANIRQGVGVLFDQAASVAASSEKMAATSAQIAQSCESAVADARAATDSAEKGSLVVANAIAGMERIAERVRNSAETVASLGTRSDQIGAIAASIKEIADQTNLLALNAAIEAARAGEQGRGFAVVADEVRKLAERTTQATVEIDGMIRVVQNETRLAVELMSQGVTDVEDGTRATAESGHALREIVEKINAVTLQIDEITAAAARQTETSADIASNVVRIKDVANTTLQAAQESAAAAEQLAVLAEELHAEASRFRV